MRRLAANLSLMFAERPLADRFAAAAEAGFDAVEILFPYDLPADRLAAAAAAAGVEVALLNSPAGDWAAGERGFACRPGAGAAVRASVARALDWAGACGCPRLHLLSGIGAGPEADAAWRGHVAEAAHQCAEAGVALLVEPINPVDMPGYFLNDFDAAEARVRDLRAAGAPVGLQFDVYHAIRIHGGAADRLARAGDLIGHLQIADPADRGEPDPADPRIAAALAAADRHAPGAVLGCEWRPRGRTEDGLAVLAGLRGTEETA